MREEEFRDGFRAALGEAPDERGAAQRAAAVLHQPPARDERTGPPRAMVLAAAALAVLVLAGLLGPRLLRAAAPRGASPAAGAPAAGCRLPVVVLGLQAAASAPSSNPLHSSPAALPQFTAGFVSLATGRFVADPAARDGAMPFSRVYANTQWSPRTYDPVVKRWLPASTSQVSPDHHSYVYILQSPLPTGRGSAFDTTTLHVYDVTTGRDRALWTTHDLISDATWEADGIHAATSAPIEGSRVSFWLVDPRTGAATQTQTPLYSMAQLGAADLRAYGPFSGSGLGTDGAGRPILLDGGQNPGAHQEYFVGGPNGQRIVIHSGTKGDAFDFDPTGFTVDGDRLWAVNRDTTAIWLWTEKGGLKRYALSGIPQHDGSVFPRVVGPCV